ncbi:hypothetical protein [Actinacidiphila sp. bgisy160]|uniref:hypothetical protein n=1 Tax=Actinacidiphila sp. bgisy160 TaxID=3413796 RepID=UPI003D72371C
MRNLADEMSAAARRTGDLVRAELGRTRRVVHGQDPFPGSESAMSARRRKVRATGDPRRA